MMRASTGIQRLRSRLRPWHRRIAARLPLRARRTYLYLASVHRLPHASNPRTFTQKMNWRILHDRRPALIECCDKLAMKDRARRLVPGPELRIPETYWSGTDIREIPAELWERDWVLKPNRSSGRVILSDSGLDQAEIIRRTRDWITEDLSQQLGEWGYGAARPLIVMEERIPGRMRADGTQALPADHKVYLFDSEIAVIQVDEDRFGAHATRTIYDPQWQPLDVRWQNPRGPVTPPPAALPLALDLARRLGEGWDHMRVDLYLVDDEVWFGEFSPYSQGGMMRFDPRSYDLTFGSRWTLPDLAEGERA